MTQDEIIEMAEQADVIFAKELPLVFTRFAKLVAAKAFEEGFFAGFSASGEGFNGECPYGYKGIDIKTDQWVLNELKEARGDT